MKRYQVVLALLTGLLSGLFNQALGQQSVPIRIDPQEQRTLEKSAALPPVGATSVEAEVKEVLDKYLKPKKLKKKENTHYRDYWAQYEAHLKAKGLDPSRFKTVPEHLLEASKGIYTYSWFRRRITEPIGIQKPKRGRNQYDAARSREETRFAKLIHTYQSLRRHNQALAIKDSVDKAFASALAALEGSTPPPLANELESRRKILDEARAEGYREALAQENLALTYKYLARTIQNFVFLPSRNAAEA